jgi:hypothetical protein
MHVICLAYEEERILNDLSVGEWQSLRQETLDYVDHLRHTGVLVDARPLQSARFARTVRLRSGDISVTDGPFAETKEQLGGFFILDVPDLETAVELAGRWPSARFGTIEIRPLDEDLDETRRY